jgi:hypothetical protein
MTDAEFKRIERDNAERVGPRAVLAAGYSATDVEALAAFLVGIGAADVRVVPCTAGLLRRTLQDALTLPSDETPLPPDKLPRCLVLSGLRGAEFHAVLDRFTESGLPRPIFAGATPNNLQLPVRQLLLMLLQEHQAMTAAKRATPPAGER